MKSSLKVVIDFLFLITSTNTKASASDILDVDYSVIPYFTFSVEFNLTYD